MIEVPVDYLSGKKFSPGLRLPIPATPLRTRDDSIMAMVRGRRVVDVGFLDSGSFESKLKDGSWLHQKVRLNSTETIGVDIDAPGLQKVEELLDVTTVCCDLSVDIPKKLRDFQPEVILCADVLEHVPNPLQFLQGIQDLAKDSNAVVAISVPNATNYVSVIAALRNQESVNSDHRFNFSPYTLAKLVWDAGFSVQDLDLVVSYLGGQQLKSKLRRAILKRLPMFRDTCLIVALPR